ncbi:glycoside hydrolase family 36 protein [Paenibacillus physcomitrellae]|uniref:Alpha-galactosidase n=1 Tax=Paenibacillus physcomitrellae TaxID=1619311 RepID=A0ABQ1GRD3_9BACL|nr:glycoside hydrolase family 36 protein [Paenibacillus physcomitrellae]GGA48557.1 hypothetical protein GCM10010917_37340 [Paenibacillus physcomitrellae]
MKSLLTHSYPTVSFQNTDNFFTVSQRIESLEEGLWLVHVHLTAQSDEQPPVCRLEWSYPAIDIHSMWHPGTDRNKAFQIDWNEGFQSRNTSLAPVVSLFSHEGRNRLTFAFTEALNEVTLKAGLREEDSSFTCSITLFETPVPNRGSNEYTATLRMDCRDLPYYEALKGVTEWWEQQPGFQPAHVPETAWNPMYSTWYSFHQEVMAEELEREARLAKEIGCDTIIVDDGWQTEDNQRGYAYTGDWEVCSAKIPDMKAHVASIHQLGMKFMLWYSVPFIGRNSKAWGRFADKLLSVDEKLNAGVLDPRYPEVREYLIQIYEQAVRDWNIDGLKLDFVDSFRLNDSSNHAACSTGHPGQDDVSVPEAIDRLMTDVMERLRAIKPDILIEFRQTYIGPLMRKYGNMFRASDCPNDFIQNRVRTLDLRLLSGRTAVHSDMIMFNHRDSVANAAMQMIHILFSVPQISVRLDQIGSQHLSMLRFWTAFCREHRDVLLEGELRPDYPELLYPLVSARNGGKQIIAVYANSIVNIEDPFEQLIVVNGTAGDRLVVRSSLSAITCRMEVLDCCGQTLQSQTWNWTKGLHEIAVPSAGLVRFTATEG